jgi:hypothetical protein
MVRQYNCMPEVNSKYLSFSLFLFPLSFHCCTLLANVLFFKCTSRWCSLALDYYCPARSIWVDILVKREVAFKLCVVFELYWDGGGLMTCGREDCGHFKAFVLSMNTPHIHTFCTPPLEGNTDYCKSSLDDLVLSCKLFRWRCHSIALPLLFLLLYEVLMVGLPLCCDVGFIWCLIFSLNWLSDKQATL